MNNKYDPHKIELDLTSETAFIQVCVWFQTDNDSENIESEDLISLVESSGIRQIIRH